jgi:uncharacterized membrane protein YhaH (DUF805 family)
MLDRLRIGRASYLAFVIALLVAHGASRLLASATSFADAGLSPAQVVDLIFLAPALALMACRLRDAEIGGLWALAYVPFAVAASFVPSLEGLATGFAYVFLFGVGVPGGREE